MRTAVCFAFLFVSAVVRGLEEEARTLRLPRQKKKPQQSISEVELEVPEVVDVLIIGAGMAGMGAATELERFTRMTGSPDLKVKVIEAGGRVGGRAVAAGWFAGGMEGHPLGEIAFRLYGNDITVETQNWASIKYYDTLTNNERGRLNRAFYDAYECLQLKALEYQQSGSTMEDMSVDEVLKNHCNWDDSVGPDAQEKFMRTWYNIQYESAVDPQKISVANFPFAPYIDQQDKDVFLVGMSFADIVRDELNYWAIDYQTGVKAVSINYSGDPVIVTTQTGTGETIVYHAKTVIPTFSTGVLKAQDFLTLPPENLEGMNALSEMALYYRFTVQFPEVFFDDFEQFLAITPTSQDKRGRCNYWQVLDTKWDSEFYPGSHALECPLMTEVIRDIEAAGGAELNSSNPGFVASTLRELIEESLGSKYRAMENLEEWTFVWKDFGPNAPPRGPPPTDDKTIFFTFASHEDNELWRGSYMNTPFVAGRTYDDILDSMDAFRAPFGGPYGDAIRLAGSATCFRYGGWMQGGYYSGIKVVNEYLDAKFPNLPHPNSREYCDLPPATGAGTVLKAAKQPR